MKRNFGADAAEVMISVGLGRPAICGGEIVVIGAAVGGSPVELQLQSKPGSAPAVGPFLAPWTSRSGKNSPNMSSGSTS